MSWGGGEFQGESSSAYDGHFSHAGVAYVASSGDSGAPVSWPAASPNIVAVGGTALYTTSGGTWSSETGWSGSGGGPSAYETKPSYQSGVVTQTTKRANPDVAYDASPSTGFAVYDSFVSGGSSPGWFQVGGTSAGAPQWAALLAISDEGRALNHLPALDSTSPQEVLTRLYQNANSTLFHDVTSGTSTGSPNYSAGAGYDYVTGIGSPLADQVVQTLVGVSSSPVQNDHLVVSVPSACTAGTSFNVTVTAQGTTGSTDTAYLGTIHFSSRDVQAGLPANYTFTAADAGSHTFTVTLKTAGSQTVTATDTAQSTVTTTSAGIAISPAAASQIILTGLSSSATVGATQTITVTLKDSYGNVATGYLGTVGFSSSDAQGGLPSIYTFTATDAGAHTFSLTFGTTGTQTVTVSDAAAGLSATSSGTSVSPAAPVSLTASAASSSQINLSWTGASGASGYLVERSANGSTGWTQIGSTAAGTTSYQDTGLSARTTYYYRVRASGTGSNSAYSNTASATTTGALSTGTSSVSLWGNATTPQEDSYSSGSYELGEKIRTDVSGTVSALRFYKQSWMNGYTHVGHLWSSNGVLLASATFRGESASGWQQVTLSRPVAIAANTVYIVSFSSGGGYFGISSNYFSLSGVDSGSLHALSNSVAGGDGVYHTGNGSFPSVSGNGMNFWADLVFNPTATASSVQTAASAATPTFAVASPAPASPAAVPAVAPAVAGAATVADSWPYRGVVPQATTLASRTKGSLFYALGGY
jgi:hypothetical protein